MKSDLKRISKFLSLVLRHQPEKIGLTLDSQGWANTQELLEKINKSGTALNLATLQEVVGNNNKKRFAFNPDGSKIRASQGHSIQIDLGYTPTQPPEFLYHGTATRFLESIQQDGLNKGARHHVHLSKDLPTAKSVGGRHGVPVILTIKAQAMFDDGCKFFVSVNGVWLTDSIPVKYIEFP
ncbi:MAG: RNA 2'-phosphotransferase [Aureispira sp.]|nr:RNA 2'-phosphotransferase [Aureispira sp.]